MALRISNKMLKENALRTIKRFPTVITFIMLLTTAFSYMILKNNFCGTLIFYFSAAALLSLLLQLWKEEEQNINKYFTISILFHLLLIIDAISVYNSPDGNEKTTVIAQGSIIFAMIIGVCFLPFTKENNDLASWHFVRKTLFRAVISFFVCGIVGGGIMLLISSLDPLFGITISTKLNKLLGILFYITTPLLIFLSQIPYSKNKFDRSTELSPFLTGTIRYLFIPLVLAYVVVMYVYVIKVLVQMELPNGAVSWLVTTMMLGFIGIEYLIYPRLRGNINNFEKWISRKLSLVMLPPIILMTIGIIRRFNDYGVTDNRLYILTLNLWFYVVCIGIFLSKARRINWISISFGFLLLLTSALPINYRNIAKWSIKRDISYFMLQKAPKEMPMNELELKNWLEGLDEKEGQRIYEKLKYIKKDYPAIESNEWLNKEVNLWGSYKHFLGIDNTNKNVNKYYNERGLKIPSGYTNVDYINFYECKFQLDKKNKNYADVTIQTNSKMVSNNGKLNLRLDIKDLKYAIKTNKQLVLKTSNTEIIVAPNNIEITKRESNLYLTGSAFIFKK